jgi:hypothetical protein
MNCAVAMNLGLVASKLHYWGTKIYMAVTNSVMEPSLAIFFMLYENRGISWEAAACYIMKLVIIRRRTYCILLLRGLY